MMQHTVRSSSSFLRTSLPGAGAVQLRAFASTSRVTLGDLGKGEGFGPKKSAKTDEDGAMSKRAGHVAEAVKGAGQTVKDAFSSSGEEVSKEARSKGARWGDGKTQTSIPGAKDNVEEQMDAGKAAGGHVRDKQQ